MEMSVALMPNVKYSWETRLGEIGESEIKKRLLYFAKPTKVFSDVGIDFYCELLRNDSPTLPFHVQAKGTEHFDENWTGYIKKSTVLYWLSQSFPVFLIVYDENNGNCYWMSIEEQRYSLILKLQTVKSDKIPFKLDRSNIFETGKGTNQEFIKKIKDDYYSIELFSGHPLLIGDGYVKKMPNPPRSQFELNQIKENVRMSLYSLLKHHLANNEVDDAMLLCHFLVKFDLSHYNHFHCLGMLYEKLGNTKLAKKYLKEALKICKRDKKWPKESMHSIICEIESKIESLDQKCDKKITN